MKCIISFGTVSGYGSNDGSLLIEKVSEDLKEILENVYNETGIYPSGILTSAKAIYRSEWGCPIGGEDVFTYSSSHNPEFSELENWKNSILTFAKEVKFHFMQSTITIDWIDSKITYLK